MMYNITVTKDELREIIQGLTSDFQECWNHVEDLRCFDEDSRIEFKCAMGVGRLIERLIRLYEADEE